MAKPEPTPSLKARHARDFAERLKSPRMDNAAKELYRGIRANRGESSSDE